MFDFLVFMGTNPIGDTEELHYRFATKLWDIYYGGDGCLVRAFTKNAYNDKKIEKIVRNNVVKRLKKYYGRTVFHTIDNCTTREWCMKRSKVV